MKNSLLKFASFSRHLPFYRSVHCCSIFTSKMWVVIRYTRWNREVIKHDAAILKPYFTPSSVKLYHPFRKTKNSCLKALVKSILQFTVQVRLQPIFSLTDVESWWKSWRRKTIEFWEEETWRVAQRKTTICVTN